MSLAGCTEMFYSHWHCFKCHKCTFTEHTRFCFDMVWHWPFLPTLFRVVSLALGQSCDCPSASETTLKNMGKSITWIHRQLIWYGHNLTTHNFPMLLLVTGYEPIGAQCHETSEHGKAFCISGPLGGESTVVFFVVNWKSCWTKSWVTGDLRLHDVMWCRCDDGVVRLCGS